jgi:hypothetical protein
MSKEPARGYHHEETVQAQAPQTPARPATGSHDETAQISSDTTSSGIPSPGTPTDEQKPSAKAASAGNTTANKDESCKPRQVIAVSASRGPAAFFNLARKFLVTDETCDLSALEGAIVSAVDAAHLLERSRLATIVRSVQLWPSSLGYRSSVPLCSCIVNLKSVLLSRKYRVQTSYVTVEPKQRKLQPASVPMGDEQLRLRSDVAQPTLSPPHSEAGVATQAPAQGTARQRGSGTAGGRELRRARIVITVKRTQSYEQWLEENPLQAIIAGDGDDDTDTVMAEPVAIA